MLLVERPWSDGARRFHGDFENGSGNQCWSMANMWGDSKDGEEGHVLVEVDATVGKFAEGSLLLELCSSTLPSAIVGEVPIFISIETGAFSTVVFFLRYAGGCLWASNVPAASSAF